MIYNLARFNCYNDTCRGSLIFPVGKWPIKIGLIYDQRCILIAATAAIVRLISLCARKKIKRKKKGRKKRKKREKYIQGEQKREGLDEEENDYIVITAGTKSYAAKESCQITLEMTLYVYDIVFFYLLTRDKVSKISIFSKFNIRFFWSFMYRWSYDLIVKWEMESRCERVKFQEIFSITFFLSSRNFVTRWIKIEIYIYI